MNAPPTFPEVGSSFGYRLLLYAVRFDTRLHPSNRTFDEALIIPALVSAALRFVPRELVSEHREQHHLKRPQCVARLSAILSQCFIGVDSACLAPTRQSPNSPE